VVTREIKNEEQIRNSRASFRKSGTCVSEAQQEIKLEF